MRLSFWQSATNTTNGGTQILSRAQPAPLPPLSTPWVRLGGGLDVGRVVAKPAGAGKYELALDHLHHNAIMLGTNNLTVVEGPYDMIDALNQMAHFFRVHDDAPWALTIIPGYTDFRKHAAKLGLSYDAQEGYVSSAPAIRVVPTPV